MTCGAEVLFETCVAVKFANDDDDDDVPLVCGKYTASTADSDEDISTEETSHDVADESRTNEGHGESDSDSSAVGLKKRRRSKPVRLIDRDWDEKKDAPGRVRKKRCRKCEGCLTPECGKCDNCRSVVWYQLVVCMPAIQAKQIFFIEASV